MGGHALNELNIVRLKKDAYFLLEHQVSGKLKSIFDGLRIACIPAYRNKPDYGDMDIVVESDKLPNDWMDRVTEAFSPLQSVKNGPVFSFDVENFQVDMVLVPSNRFDFAVDYYAWNDCGNLIGRVAKGCGYKFGHEGLFYVFRDQHSYQDTLLVSRDFEQTLAFFGYSYERHQAGFSELDEMFKFVMDTPYFREASFLLENQNHTSRVRIKKRPSYSKFLEFITKNPKPSFMPDDREGMKVLFLEKGFSEFQGFRQRYLEAQEKYEKMSSYKAKYNGELVSEYSGLKGKELGALMNAIQGSFASKDEFMAFVINADEFAIEKLVKSHYPVHSDNQRP